MRTLLYIPTPRIFQAHACACCSRPATWECALERSSRYCVNGSFLVPSIHTSASQGSRSKDAPMACPVENFDFCFLCHKNCMAAGKPAVSCHTVSCCSSFLLILAVCVSHRLRNTILLTPQQTSHCCHWPSRMPHPYQVQSHKAQQLPSWGIPWWQY